MDRSSPDETNLRIDAHGRAALLLCESLIHALIERGVLTVAEAMDIVDTATAVSSDLELSLTPALGERSVDLLNAIARSLRTDLSRSSLDH